MPDLVKKWREQHPYLSALEDEINADYNSQKYQQEKQNDQYEQQRKEYEQWVQANQYGPYGDERDQAAPRGVSNALTPEMEYRHQQASGGGNRLTPYQVAMQAEIASLPTAPETRSNAQLRNEARSLDAASRVAKLESNRQGLLLSQDPTKMYNQQFTTGLRDLGKTANSLGAKAATAKEYASTIAAERAATEAWQNYAHFRDNPDFIANSKPDPKVENRVYYSMAHPEEAIEENGAAVNAAAYADEDDKAMYFYLWNTYGHKAADKFYDDYVLNKASAAKAADVQRRAMQEGYDKPFVSSVKSIGTNVISGVGLVDMFFQNIARDFGITNPNRELNYNSLAQMPSLVTDSIREGVMKNINGQKVDDETVEAAAWTAAWLYQNFMSAADSGVGVVLTALGVPSAATLAIMAGAAGTRAIQDARKRGATDSEALRFGMLSAAAEAAFEKISLDVAVDSLLGSMGRDGVYSIGQAILKALGKENSRNAGTILAQWALNSLTNSFVEGSEELLTTIANDFSDRLILGDRSEFEQKHQELLAMGVSDKEAARAALKSTINEALQDAAAGAFSGFLMGGGTTFAGQALRPIASTISDRMQLARNLTDYQRGAQQLRQMESELRQVTRDQSPPAEPAVQQRQLTEREQNPLQFALTKAQNGETVTGQDAKAIIADPQAMQTLRDAGVLAENIRPGAEGRTQIQQAVQALAEQTRAETPETQRVTERTSQLPVQNQQETAQERTTPPLPRQVAQEQQERVTTPPVPQNTQEAAQEPTLRLRAQEEQAPRQETLRIRDSEVAEPTRQAPLTIRGANATVEENRQEENYGQGQQTETAAAAGEDDFRARAETAAEGARRSYLDRIERSSGLGRVLQDLRNYRLVRGAESRASEVSRIRNQAEAGNQREVSAQDYGLANGTADKTAVEIDNATLGRVLGRGWTRAVDELARQGVTLKGITGQLWKADGPPARAFFSGDGKTIVVQVDNPRLSWNQLLDHEDLHRRIKENPAYRKAVEDALLADKKLQAYLPEIIDRYSRAYAEHAPDLTSDDVIEELLADYRAGFDMLDPLGMNTITARAAKRAAKDIKSAEKTLRKQVEEQRPVSVDDEAKASREFDSDYMQAAVAYNQTSKHVPDSLMNDVAKVRETIKAKLEEIQDEARLPADVTGNTYFGNGSYNGSEENTTVCPRSLSVDALADAVGDALGRPLTIEETVYVAQQAFHFTDVPQCLYCYVAMDRMAKRQLLGEYVNKRTQVLTDIQNGMSREEALAAYKKRETSGGKQWSKNKQARFERWVNDYESGKPTLKMSDLSSEAQVEKTLANPDFRAEAQDALQYAQNASCAKKRVGFTAYNNHILKWDQKRINALNSMFGLRMYSFSDFSPAFILENMQMVTDAAVRGLKMLAYTKELDFARIFAGTGMNINISTFGMDGGDGKVHMDAMQGADWKEAQELRKKYPNVGVTFVATNDNQVKWALDQDWIDVVIPFHMVKTGATVADILGYQNYTGESSDKKIAGEKAKQKEIFPSQHQNNKEKYLAVLEKAHLTPRFERWLDNPNYMKLVNETRRSAGDTPAVQPKFDQDAVNAALKSLDDMVKRGGYGVPIGGSLENLADIAEEMSDDIRKGIAQDLREHNRQKGKASTEIDADYLAAVNSGDMETAQRMVDEAAKAAGYRVEKYHGTKANFNTFNPDYARHGASGFGYYFGDKEIADEFGEGGRVFRVLINDSNIGTQKSHNITVDGFESAFKELGLSPENTYQYLGSDTAAEYVKAHHDYRLATDLQYWAVDPERFAEDPKAKEKTPREIISILKDNLGLDGIKRDNFGKEVVLWDNTLMKLADPVTYDDNGKVIPLSQRFNTKNEDIRYSTEISEEDLDEAVYEEMSASMRGIMRRLQDDVDRAKEPEQKPEPKKKAQRASDEEYMAALEDGDIAKAQRLVRETADAAMPKSKVRSASTGELRYVYHYTNKNFYEFRPMDQSAGSNRTLGDGYYVSTSETEFKNFGKNKMTLFANITKPFEMSLTKKQAQTIYDKYFRPLHPNDIGKTYEDHVLSKLQTESRVFDYLKEAAEKNGTTTSKILTDLGFDGVHDGVEWVAFKPEQLKSADVGTYNDDGQMIPLSERFNPKEKDTRYSIEIDPEVAAQFSPEAIARRQSNRTKGVKGERKVSRVRSNTYEYSGLYNEVEAQMDEADEENYTYDPVSEKKSMNEALGRLKADFDGEVSRLSEADRQWGGSDLDTAMGILHRYRTEGRATGDYGDFWRWSKVIQEKGTKGGQFIQAFAKYTRTGTGAAMKGAKDIHDRFKLNPAQQKQVDAAKKKLMDGIDSDMNGAAQDAMKQAKGQKEPGKKQDGKVDKKKLDAEVQRRKDAERLVREISKLFEKQQDHGEPVENWLNLTGEELARKIAGRFSEPKQRTKTTMQTILSDLVGFAEEHALPDRKKAEGTKRTAIDIITDYLNNRDAYGTAWAAAQSYLRAAYTDDQEKLDALNSFLTATIAYNAEGTDRTMLDAILQSADVLGISEKRILELTSAGATASTIDRIGDELVNQVKERMGADYDESFTQQLKDAVRRHITGIALQESAEEQRLRLGGMTTDAARQLEINLQKLLTQSRGDKNRAAQSVADYLIRELGIPSSDAAIAAERITGAFMDELANRADRKLQQMFAAKAPKTQEQRDKLLDLIRLGGLTNSNVEDAVVDALGIGGMSRERQRELVGIMAQFGETLDAMEADDLDGLKDLIRAQAAVRNTPLSRQAEKTLAGETDAEYLREFALAQLDAIAGDFAEMSPGAKISTFQTISHLLNMRTALRNLTSNQVFDLVDSAANNLATIPDMVIGAFTGKRTVGVNKSWLSEMKRAGAKQGAARNALEVRLDVSPDDRQKSKYGTAGRRTNSMAASNAFGRILSHLEEVMGYELNTTDEFHKGSVRGETLESLARFVERGDITQEQANAWAEEEALYRSFQDDTLVGNIMGELKTLLNVIGFGDSGKTNSRGRTIHDFGLGDLVVKYTQVPGALIHRGIEYSPLGYAKMLYDLAIAKDSLVRTQKRGEDVTNAQRKLALDIGRATTGSGLITLFAVLAKAGLLRRDDDDKDKNAKAMHAAQGLSGTQLNLTALGRWISGEDAEPQDGDVLADIGFLEPLDSLMTIATLMANDKDLSISDIGVKSLDGVWKAISNTSAMQTISNIISTVQYHDEENDLPLYFQIPIEIASDSVSGFIPSPVRQLAQATDTTYRDQYRSKALNDQIRARVMNSIPGVRQMLAPKITPLGEDRKYQKPLLNYLNATLNPGNINVYQGSGVVDELNRVYGETDDAKIWPERNAPYSFTANDEKWTLTPDERTQYQRTRGQETAKFIEAVMGANWYKAMSPDSQAKILNDVGNFANYIAKKEMLDARGVEYASDDYQKLLDMYLGGATPADVMKEANKKLAGLMDAGLTEDQAKEAKGLKTDEFREYIKNQDLSDEDKLSAMAAVLGTEMTTPTGKPTQWAQLNNAVNGGLSIDRAIELVQSNLLDDYTKYADAGLTSKTSDTIVTAISKLKPEKGYDDVRDVQKWNAIINTVNDKASQEKALKAVMKDSQWASFQEVKSADVSAATYVKFKYDTRDYSSTRDETTGKEIKGQTKKDKMMSYIDGLNIPDAQKDALYLVDYAESGLKDTPWHKGGGKGTGSNAIARLRVQKQPWEVADDMELRSMNNYGGNVDLTNRKSIPITQDNIDTVHGWNNMDDARIGDRMTVASQTYNDGDTAIVVTPILPDGTLMTQRELDRYMDSIIRSGDYANADKRGIILGVFDDGDWNENLAASDEFANRLHELHERKTERRSGLRLPDIPKAAKPSSGLRLPATNAAPRQSSGLRLK